MSELFKNRPFAFQAMVKPIGSSCNLNCTYCYYLEKEKLFGSKKTNRMSDELLEKYIRQYIAVQQVNVVNFVWQGGEPSLLGLDYFKRIIELQHKYGAGKRIENSFQTNGTLLNDDWGRFLKQHNFLVGISIDGPEHIHNQHRTYLDGRGSFSQVMNGIEVLKKHNVDFNTLSVVNRHNSKYPEEIYQFLKRIGSGYLQFIPIVERQVNKPRTDNLQLTHAGQREATVTDWSVLPEDYGQFLIGVFNEWIKTDVGTVFVQQFDAALANWVGESAGICIFSKTCGDSVVVEHNGDVFSCDHFVYPEYKLGNINDTTLFSLVQSKRQETFGLNKLHNLPRQCKGCHYRFACHGECPKHRFTYSSSGEYGLNYLCKGYQLFFEHIYPYIDFMANELAQHRAPANVMGYAKNYQQSN